MRHVCQRALSVLLLAAGLSGCSVIADLDRFETEGGFGRPACDLELNLEGFAPHVTQLVDVRVQSLDDDRVRARAIFDPLGSPNMRLVMPDAVPTGDYSIDFFADLSNNRQYDPIPADHAWRIMDPCATAPNNFPHNFDFVDLPAPAEGNRDVRVAMRGMTTNGGVFELRVSHILVAPDPANDVEGDVRVIGLYRTTVDAADFDLAIPAVIPPDACSAETPQCIQIAMWQDGNGNGMYDPPPTDEAWRLAVTPERADGLMFEHIVEYVDIGFTLTSGTN